MNRLEATVADAQAGEVDYGGISARGRRGRAAAARGERVLVLVRPETVELAAANGDGAGALAGEIDLAHVPRPGHAAEGRARRGRD